MLKNSIRPTQIWKQKSVRPKKRRRKRRVNKVLMKNVILAMIALFIGGSLFALAGFAWITRDLPDPNALTERSVDQTTKIYDRTGEHLLYEIHGAENRTLVKLEEIPDNLKNATIAPYSHASDLEGYDPGQD